MNSLPSSLQNFWEKDYPQTLTESGDFIQECIQKLDACVLDYQVELQNGIEADLANINDRQARIDKWIQRTNGNLPPNQRAELAQISHELKDLQRRNKDIDKDVKNYREALMDNAVTDIFEPQIKTNVKSLENYLEVVLSDTCDSFDLDADFRQKIMEIENTPLPEKPIKKEIKKPKSGCVYVVIFLFLSLIFLFITNIIAASVVESKGVHLAVIFVGLPFVAALSCTILIAKANKKNLKALEDKYNYEIKEWEKEINHINELKFQERDKVVAKMNLINSLLESYRSGNKESIINFIIATLDRLPKIFHPAPIISVDYTNSNFIINYILPTIEDLQGIPIAVESKRGQVIVTPIKNTQLIKIYNKLVYDIILSIIHSVYKYDENELITSVTVNGIMDTIDKSVGKNVKICACSLQMGREEFSELNLELIDSYECFRRFKGVAAANIADKVAVRPIQQIQDKDRRFVEGYCVASELQRGTNLATMPWQDFENLIRELFEKLFSKHGGSCKVTRASRDGGVDAVAFNPDPISGGKFIIQAKRYTNLVSPSAVRDLYGTLQHEGANKAILVTTSDYGGDSYSFAKDKPIQLLNGSHLLHYLKEELGMTDVYINLDEAKKINKEN